MPFDYIAHHVGRASYKGLEPLNKYSIGIELINWGKLERVGDKWVSLSNVPIPASEVFKDKQGGGWHKYTDKQIQTALGISQVLVAAYPSIEDIIGHETVSPERKSDPGPAFPLEEIRNATVAKKR